jgi:general secretion pathway protein I
VTQRGCQYVVRRKPRADRRRGLTLMEVIVAMAIFLMSLAAIVPLMNLGLNRANEVELHALGLQKAQSKMSEVIAGAVPLGSQSSVPFDEDQSWTWSLDASQDGTINNLWQVTVTVSHPNGDSKIEVTLNEMLRDPSILPPWTSNQLQQLGTPTTSSSSSSSSSGSTTGGM